MGARASNDCRSARVLALVTLPTLGAGNRLRIEQYAKPLRRLNIELVVSPFFDDDAYKVLYTAGNTLSKLLAVTRGLARRTRDLLRVRSFDLVVVYRESAPVGPPLFERVLRMLGVRFVFDFDDAIFLGPIHPANRRWSWLRDPSRVAETARRATAVIAGNAYLADWAREHNPNVTIITTPVDAGRHHPATESKVGRPVVLGWVGSSTTAPYLRLLDDVLTELERRADFVVRVVGGQYEHPAVAVDVRPYAIETEPSELEDFDIGLLPEPDDSWTRGKGAFKALLYMATGVPVVASRVGVNPNVVIEGETGFCVSGVAEWVAALEQLVTDPSLRERMGRAGRERAERLYSLEVLAPRFAAVLRNAMSMA